MQALVDDKGQDDSFFIDSAGTGSWHVGDRADVRMRRHAEKRGLKLTSISRQLTVADLDKFDFIVCMDRDNLRNVRKLDIDDEYDDKILLMTDFCTHCTEKEVPDPYYGGDAGFERVLDILEDACNGLFEYVIQNKSKDR